MRQGVPANGEQKGMNDQIGIIAGGKGFPGHLTGDRKDVVTRCAHHANWIRSRIIETLADDFRIACQRHEGNIVMLNKAIKAMRRSQPHLVPGSLQTEGQRQERLNISARSVRKDRNSHRYVFYRSGTLHLPWKVLRLEEREEHIVLYSVDRNFNILDDAMRAEKLKRKPCAVASRATFIFVSLF